MTILNQVDNKCFFTYKITKTRYNLVETVTK